MENKFTPFDPERYIGTITVVTPNSVKANFPHGAPSQDDRKSIRGSVGDFIFIECDQYAIFGRITEISLPDRERLSVEPQIGKNLMAHPIGNIQLLATMDVMTHSVIRGLPSYPRIGDRIYIAHASLITKMAQASDKSNSLTMPLGTITVSKEADVSISPESLFGRHCGILGATGGGKSWTLARLLESIHDANGKAILFDATGEFADLPFIDTHLSMGSATHSHEKAVGFSYRNFTEEDLFAFFTPSGQSQGPKLREAIKSLKLVEALKGTTPPDGLKISEGVLFKKDCPRKPFLEAIKKFEKTVYSEFCNFEINDLSDQVGCECIYSSNDKNPGSWGNINLAEVGYCSSLRMRIEQRTNAPELSSVFVNNLPSLTEEISSFLNSKSRILRISMKNLSFQYNTREVIVNAIGRYLLKEARNGKFMSLPLVCLLDEAHQFLDIQIGDDNTPICLDAFGLIAKECRKYGLTVVLATQRPRDIPEDILSQLGTLIVHRLTNDKDRSVVERACGEIDRSAADFLPMLGQGEALIVGTDFPMPVPLKIKMPSVGPNSLGPQYQKFWKRI